MTLTSPVLERTVEADVPRVKVGLYSNLVLHYVETCALFIAESEQCEVSVITQSDLSSFKERAEHRSSCERLSADGRIQILDREDEPRPLDWLLIHMECYRRVRSPSLNRWVRAARNIGCLTEAELRTDLRGIARELVRGFPYYLQARSVVLQMGSGKRHPYFFVPRKAYFSPSTHPQFLLTPRYRQAMFAPPGPAEIPRRFRLGFIGNREPPERAAVLRRVRRHLECQPTVCFTDDPDVPPPSGRAEVLWMDYGDDGPRRDLTPDRYVDALNTMEFCLCPLGWGGCWTHRVVEALLRGAIPITENEDRYNFDLRDGEHCLVVQKGRWEEAVDRALTLSTDEIIRMRRQIQLLAATRISPAVAARRLREQLGLPV